MALRLSTTETFKYGIVDTIEARSIPRGAASRSLNWLTLGDRIELRRGFEFMGSSSIVSGTGKVTGLKRATNAASVEVLFYTYGAKAKYYDESTDEWVEIGSNLLGATASTEEDDISIEEYVTLAGNQVWLNSPNCAGVFKIMTANPGSAVDQYDSAKNYKGNIKIDTNSMFLWGRKKDLTGVYRSYIDAQAYTTVSSEVVADTASGTLAFKSGGSKRTCFAIVITDTSSGEVFTDNYDGTLTGSLGGTGTINYATGAFTTSQSGAGTADYQWEDATNTGIADFTGSAAGTGATFRQDEGGGPVKGISSYSNIYFCFHQKKTWALTLAVDDTPASTSNVPYRENVGIPTMRARVDTGDGIYYVDVTSGNDPAVRRLSYDRSGSQQVIPIETTSQLDLNDYSFDQAVGGAFGDWIMFSCRTQDSAKNDRTLLYNKRWKSWDVLDYAVSGGFDVYNGALVAGDAITSNVMTLFSGWTDDESPIRNYWEGKLDDLDIAGLKKSKQFRMRGAIGIEQKIKVSLAFDNGPFVEIGGTDNADGSHTYAIEGGGSYVDQTQRVSIGPLTLGRGAIGGGGDGLEAYNYERVFKITSDKFEVVKIRIEAVDVGYASVEELTFWDVRFKGVKTPRKYRG